MARGERVLTRGASRVDRAPGGNRVPWTLIKTAVAALLIGYLIRSGRIDVEELTIKRPSDIVVAQGLWFIAFLVTVLRWHILLGALDVPHRRRDALRLCSLGLFFSQVIPGATGGDLVRGIQIARESPGRRPNAVLSVLLDRVLGLTALMMIGAIGVFFCPPEVRALPLVQNLRLVLFGILGFVFVGGALLSFPALWRGSHLLSRLGRFPGGRVVGKLATALWAMRRRWTTIAMTLGLSAIAHGLFVLAAIFVGRGLTVEEHSIANYFFIVPLGQLAFSLPLTPGGTGVGQWAYDELFAAVGSSHGAELGVLLQATSVFWALFGVFALFHSTRAVRREWQQAQVEDSRPDSGETDPG